MQEVSGQYHINQNRSKLVYKEEVVYNTAYNTSNDRL